MGTGEKNPWIRVQLGHCHDWDEARNVTSCPETQLSYDRSGLIPRACQGYREDQGKGGACLSPGDLPELGLGALPMAQVVFHGRNSRGVWQALPQLFTE